MFQPDDEDHHILLVVVVSGRGARPDDGLRARWAAVPIRRDEALARLELQRPFAYAPDEAAHATLSGGAAGV